MQQRRCAQAAGGLDDHLHALGEEAHGGGQLFVGDGDDALHQALDDREGQLPAVLGLRAIGNGLRRCDVHDLAARQALLGVVAGLGLDTDHGHARAEMLSRHRATRDQTAAAHANQQQVQRAGFLQQFSRRRALPGHHMRMVIGRDQRHAALDGQASAYGFAVFGVAVVEHHFAAGLAVQVFPRGGQLGGR